MRRRSTLVAFAALALALWLAADRAHAQKTTPQALESELSGAVDPARKLDLLIQLSAAEVESASEDAVRHAEEAITIAESLAHNRGAADAWLNLSRALLQLRRYDRAVVAVTRASGLYRELKLPDLEAEAAFTRANISFNRGEYRKATGLYDALLKTIDESSQPSQAAAVLGYLANSWLLLGDPRQAATFQSRALELRRKTNDEDGVASGLIALGSIEYSRGRLDEAAAAYQDALSISERLNNANTVSLASVNLGLLLFDREKFEEAEAHLSRAIEISRRLKEQVRLAAALRGLAWVRQKQSRGAEAQTLLEEAELNENANRRLAEALARFESELKAREVERLERDREIQNLVLQRQTVIRNSAIGGAALVTALLLVAVNAFRVKRRAAEQLAIKNRDLSEANHVIANERARSEQLLLSILPPAIASRLKLTPGTIADSYPAATVLFADIVGFTPLSREIGPKELVRLLDQIFSRFDALASRHRLEKIKTIGDCYMVVGGLPEPTQDHCERVAAMSLDLLREVRDFNQRESTQMNLRIGFHVGPVVAGVIGRQKFSYDLWGETVNTASRLESTSAPGLIHVSREVARALDGKFALEPRGSIEVKGIGFLETYFLGPSPKDSAVPA